MMCNFEVRAKMGLRFFYGRSLLSLLLVHTQLLCAQKADESVVYAGIVEDRNEIIATFTVIKTLQKDSIDFSYILLHDGDTTTYDLKYANKACCKTVFYKGDNYSVSDSLKFNDGFIYVYDFNFPDSNEIEGFFTVSPTFGLISVGDFSRADYLKFDGHPNFNAIIEPYRERRASMPIHKD